MRSALIAISSLAATSAAGDFSLDFPLDCTLEETCFIQHFMDHDPSENATDFTCGPLTYDGHKGTDFALNSLALQAAGVDVFAAAAGTVMGVRNDMDDILQLGADAPDVSDRECGNGVVLKHDDGYETQYCHMAKGSITVASGQTVQAGDVLGRVGLSGDTQFPHLHISVRKDGAEIDPFDTDGAQVCDDTHPILWADPIATPEGGIINVGISEGIPEFDAVKNGTADTGVASDGAGFVAWAHLFGTQQGDTLSFQMMGPNGEAFASEETLERTQDRAFRAAGKRTPPAGWPAGSYTLIVTQTRAGDTLDTITQSFEIN